MAGALSDCANPGRFSLLHAACRIAAALVVAVGALVLFGWTFHIESFVSVLPARDSINPNMALLLVLSGISLWILLPGNARTPARYVARVLAFLVALAGAATRLEYLLGLNFGIDQILFKEPLASVTTPFPGRMSPILIGLVSGDWLEPSPPGVADEGWPPAVARSGFVACGGGADGNYRLRLPRHRAQSHMAVHAGSDSHGGRAVFAERRNFFCTARRRHYRRYYRRGVGKRDGAPIPTGRVRDSASARLDMPVRPTGGMVRECIGAGDLQRFERGDLWLSGVVERAENERRVRATQRSGDRNSYVELGARSPRSGAHAGSGRTDDRAAGQRSTSEPFRPA